MAWYLASLFALLLTLPWWPLPNWPMAPIGRGSLQPAALERIDRQHWQLAQTSAPAELTARNP
jgi:hypothetical protein